MEWINLKVSTIRRPEYVSSPPVARSTWFNVLSYSAEQDNGGRLVGARAWSDRRWQQTCGVTRREVAKAEPLLMFDGDDLIVWEYPIAKEAEVRYNREFGRLGGIVSSEAKQRAARLNGAKGGRPPVSQPETQAETQANPSGESQANPRERKGKEGNGMEGKGKEHTQRGREMDRTLPEALDREPFLSAWSDWYDYLTEKNNGRSVPSQTFDAHLRACLTLGPVAGTHALRTAISRNLREPAETFSKISIGAGGVSEPFNPDIEGAHTGGAKEAV